MLLEGIQRRLEAGAVMGAMMGTGSVVEPASGSPPAYADAYAFRQGIIATTSAGKVWP